MAVIPGRLVVISNADVRSSVVVAAQISVAVESGHFECGANVNNLSP